MNSASSFQQKIDTLMLQRKRRKLFNFLLWSLTFFLILKTTVLLWGKVFFPLSGFFISYPVPFLLALGLAWLIHRLFRKDLSTELLSLDSRMGLNDRISTAFEYLTPDKKSLLKEKLLEDAAKIMGGLPQNKILPWPFSPAYLLLPAFLFLQLLIPRWDLPHPGFTGKNEAGQLARIGKFMAEFTREKMQNQDKTESPSGGEPYRELQALAEDLEDQSLTRKELVQTLGEMKKKVREERSRMSRNLMNDLNAGQASDKDSPASQTPTPSSPQALDRLTEKLKDLFEGHLPESLTKDLSRLRENFELEKFLDQALGMTFVPGTQDNNDALLTMEEKGHSRGSESGEGKNSPATGLAEPPSGRWDQEGGPGDSKNGRGKDGRRKEEGQGPPRPGGEGNFTAGTAKGSGEKLTPSELKPGKGSLSQERGLPSGTAPSPSLGVRSQPLFGKTEEIREQNLKGVPFSTRREKESALRQEKIPREYREVIKNYFLSIKEDKGIKPHEQSR
ncbi:MAG: hypothetical protein AB1585_19380 [Thermodesulfobacteriota bacterium]